MVVEYRISVCLTKYFNDERSYCYVQIDDGYQNVSGLENYLRRLFNINGEFCLMNTNHYLPSDEKVQIIRPDDTITVVPLLNNWRVNSQSREREMGSQLLGATDAVSPDKLVKKKKKKKVKQEIVEDPELAHLDRLIADLKEDCDNATDKQHTSVDDEPTREVSECESDMEEASITTRGPVPLTTTKHNEQSTLEELKKKALSMLNDVAGHKFVEVGSGGVGVANVGLGGVSGGRVNKRKRVRKRNRKPSLSVSTPELSDSASSTPLVFRPIKISTHTRFEDMEPRVVQNANVKSNSNDGSGLEGHPPRLVRALDSSHLDCGSVTNSTKSGVREGTPTVAALLRRISEFPMMDSVPYPMPEDLILFKMVRLSEKSGPELSSHILGRVMEVDKPSGLVAINILDGDAGCDSSVDVDGDHSGQVIRIKWSQVVEPRLIFL